MPARSADALYQMRPNAARSADALPLIGNVSQLSRSFGPPLARSALFITLFTGRDLPEWPLHDNMNEIHTEVTALCHPSFAG